MRKLLLIFAATCCLFAVFPAAAQTPEATPAANPAQMGHFRIANFAADMPSVDVWIDNQEAQIAGLKAGEISAWMNIPPGDHSISAGTAGSTSDKASLPARGISTPQGAWTTIAIVGASADGSLRTSVFQQDMTELTPGVTRVTFLNAVNAEPVNLLRDGVPYVTSLDFPKAYAVDEDWGTHTFEAQTGGDKPVSLATLKAELREATYYIVALTIDGTEQKLVALPSTSADVAVALGTLKAPGTLIEAVSGSDLTGDLSAAIGKAGLTDTLAGKGPFTLFAPNGFKLDPNMDKDALAALLKDHVVEGDLLSQELVKAGSVTTLGGKTFDVDVEGNTIMVGDARVVAVNLPATNGVIHILSKSLDG